jgi:co-chaperonin GroES (HSP10)
MAELEKIFFKLNCEINKPMKVQGTIVLIKPEENPDKTAQGIFIPKMVKDQPKTGTAIQVGSGCKRVEAGDEVYYNRKMASIIEIDGVEHHFISEKQILFVVKVKRL